MEEIYQSIPHREPFLFVDKIVEMREDGIITEREIRAEEPQFQGHYPGNPIMPGVLLCESVFQTAALYMSNKFKAEGDQGGQKTPILTRIQNAKFKQIVRPGDVVQIEATYGEALGRFHFMKGKVSVGGKTVLTVEFGLAMLDAE